MKAILAPIAHGPSYTSIMETEAPTALDPRSSASVLRTAVLLARQFGSYVECLPLGPEIPDVYGMETPGIIPAVLDDGWRQQAIAASRRAVEEFMRSEGVPERFGEPKGLCFGWRGESLQGDAFVGEHGRAFDTIVVGRPESGDGHRFETVEEALFGSGRPVLVAPPSPPREMGREVVVAWNGSTETARAIAFAMPLLVRAATATVLTVRGGTVAGPSGEEVARTLSINDVPAKALDVETDGRAVGEAILYHAGELGADLLVKGAYTHSRLRQMIFGGPTRHLLEHANVPMLMAH
jgi:nucleotide-binding universal stress UspA family protein